jgi:hypothetical protein
MAFSAVTPRGVTFTQISGSTIQLNPGADMVAGKLGIVTLHSDNLGTADGSSNDHSSLEDNCSPPNTWTKVTEHTDTDGVAGDGSVVSVWYSVLKTTVGAGNTLTGTFASAITARGMTITEATLTDGAVNVADIGVGQGSITAASATLPNREYLFFYAASSEGNDNSKTVTPNYTEQFDFRTGNTGDVNISAYVQTRIQTTTTSGSVAPTNWATNLTNPISVIVAFREVLLRLPDAATLAIAGAAPVMRLKNVLLAAAATLAIVGATPGLSMSGPQAGYRSMAGFWLGGVSAPSAGTTLSPAAGSLNIAGVAPSLRLTIRPSAASLAIAGATTSLRDTLRPAAGTLDIAGVAPGRQQSLSRAPAAASLDIAGASAPLRSTLTPSAATLAIAGGTPSIVVGRSVAPSAGSLDIAGAASSLRDTLRPTAATLALEGATPGLSLSSGKAPAAASLAIVGTAPSLRLTLQPQAANLAIAGATPGRTSGQVLAPGAASLDIAGVADTLRLTIRPTAATLALVGATPVIGGLTSLSPSAGALDIAGASASLRHVLPTTPATLALAGVSDALRLTLRPAAASLDIQGIEPILVGAVVTIAPTPADLAIQGATPAVTQTVDGDEVTFASGYFRRDATSDAGRFARAVTIKSGFVRRALTTKDGER